MGKAVKIDLRAFKEMENKIVNAQKQVDEVMRYLTGDIAALLLRKVIKRTPVGRYGKATEVEKKVYKYETVDGKRKRIDTGRTKTVTVYTGSKKTGGTLRRGWTVGEITKTGDIYKVEVINSVDYASYVEFGHRTRNHKGWVAGRFMLTISENEIRDNLESIIQKRLKVILEKMKNA